MAAVTRPETELERAARAYAAYLGAQANVQMAEDPEAIRVAANARYEAAGFPELMYPPTNLIAAPECDACGNPGARSHCAGCKSVQYCSAECQRWDWKKGGHKAACADIQSQLRADGAAVAAQLGDSFLPMGARLDDLHRVDVSFAYRAALEAGLHASLLTFLRDDAAGVTARFRSGEACSGVGLALNVLFRGQRRSRGAGTRYTRADGGRAAAFIESHPDAWPAWLGAVKALVETMADRELKRMGQGMAAQPPARDALASLLLVLAREEVARALCFVPPGGARSARPELASARMAHTAGACRRMLESARKASALGADPGSNIEGYLNQVIAQLDLWTKRFEIPDVDVLGMQRFSSAERAAYRAMAEPLARVFVEYGCMPPAHVSNAALGR